MEWDAALWVRPRVNSRANTSGAMARTALCLAERFTDERFHAGSDLVQAQAFPKHATRAASEPGKLAQPLLWHHIEALERTIDAGTTPQQRVMDGWLLCLLGPVVTSMQQWSTDEEIGARRRCNTGPVPSEMRDVMDEVGGGTTRLFTR